MPARARAVAFIVNRKRRECAGPPFRRLIDVLREDFGLTGTKEGCGEGECGACTVLLDGEPVNSCLIPVCQVEGRSVRTVESLGRPEALNALQQAFLDCGGAQCGICTPGMLMTATAWIERGGSDDPDAIRRVLAGNLCRCTGYQHIVNAVIQAVRARPAARTTAKPASNAASRVHARASRAGVRAVAATPVAKTAAGSRTARAVTAPSADARVTANPALRRPARGARGRAR
jgi:carbon-monoxide dehydrogenase small subunit